MKIGILTFHAIINDGSIMQAYCLQKKLSELLPDSRVEIIDYIPKQTMKRNLIKIYRPNFPFFYPQEIKLAYRHRKFLKTHSKLSSGTKITDDLISAVNFLNSQQYDVVCVGSDTVWDTRSKGGAKQPPNLYFLPGYTKGKKISYAASMDKGDISTFGENKWKKCIELIEDFNFIGVRDKNTSQNIEKYIGSSANVHYTPDPTIVTEFSNLVHCDQKFLSRFNGRKIAGISVSRPEIRDQLAQELKQEGFEVINMLGSINEETHSMPGSLTLEQRLGVFSRLDFLITDRFHSSIFAMKLANCPVVMLEPDYYYTEENSKGRDLFGRIGMQDYVYRYELEKGINKGFVKYWLDKIAREKPDPGKGIKDLADRAESTIKSLVECIS